MRAIREPATLYDGTIDWDLAEQLANEAERESDPLPLVQHALMRLWELNGKDLKQRDDLQDQLKEMAAGDRVVLELLRRGKAETLTLRLGEKS